MQVRLDAILLKGPVVTENVIPIFQHNGKHFSDINSMIGCYLIQDHRRCDTLRTGTQPDYYFLCELLHLLYATLSIGISVITCPHSIVLRIIDTINVKILLIGKENSDCVSFSKMCSNPICKLFPCVLLIIEERWFDNFSYRSVTLDRFSIFAGHLCGIHRAPLTIFKLILFFPGVEGLLPFECSP